MPRMPEKPTSAIPEKFEKPVRKDLRVDLMGVTRLLLDHLTPELCKKVFRKHRKTERERKWAFYFISLFWTAMIIRHPSAIEHGLSETRKGRSRDKLWPKVQASAQAFFQKCQGLRPGLFKAIYGAFIESILPKAPAAYASWMKGVRKHFPEVHIVDGSRLDAVCHGIGILREERAQVLPGCVTVFYDLFRGIARQVLFFPNAAEAELPRAQPALHQIVKGSLVVGDRLYASIQYIHLLIELELHGLFRRNGRLKIKHLKMFSRKQGSRSFLEEVLVVVGSGQRQPKIKLRLIRFRSQGKSLDLLTTVLDPKKLSAEDAVALYGLRWSIERMFLDLKETLDLHTIHSSHPNLVAQQVYAAFMVHAAFRIAQAKIAKKAKVLPEQLSPAKLFPKLARAVSDYCLARWHEIRTRELNPGVSLRFPDLRTMPSAYARLNTMLLRRREGVRRRRRFCTARKRWKSIAHVSGGKKFLRLAVVG